MENLAEQIAAELGNKWVQLNSRLELGARDRYRFVTEHKDEPSPAKEVKCARDTIRSGSSVAKFSDSLIASYWMHAYSVSYIEIH